MGTVILRINQYLVLDKKVQSFNVEVADENDFLLKVCQIMSATNTFLHYYPYSATLMLNDYFPYILRDGKYIWCVPIAEVRIKEFIDTFPDCISEGIYLETMIPSAGGRDYLGGQMAWRVVKLFITSAIPCSYIPLEIFEAFYEWSESLRGNEIQEHLTPPELISLMYKKYKELSKREVIELLGIEEYKADAFLTKIGYERIDGSEKYLLLSEKRDKVLVVASMLNDFENDYADRIASGSTEYRLLD